MLPQVFRFEVLDGDFKTSSASPGGIINRCVKVAKRTEGVAVRDSKDSAGTTLYFTCEEWTAFVAGVKAGEFD